MTDPCRSFHSIRKIFLLKPKGHVDETDQNRNLQERPDDSGKGLARVDPEDGHRNSDGEFEVIRSCREAQSGGLFISGPHLHRQEKGDKEHDHKIDKQRNGNPDHIQGKLNDVFALEREHDQDGKEKGNQGDRTDFRDEFLLVPFPSQRFETDDPVKGLRQ